MTMVWTGTCSGPSYSALGSQGNHMTTPTLLHMLINNSNEYFNSRFPMGASCGGFGINEHDYYKAGLEPNHAYSVLDVRQLDLGEGSRKLLRLRNPWRKYSWKGNWSDTDPIWESSPRLKDLLNPLGADEGIFWMEFEDFMKYVLPMHEFVVYQTSPV